jgi:hypothetical protein
MKRQADYAASLGMSIGLKNSQAILSSLAPVIQFAVNEECALFGTCALYTDFLNSGKPVFQIEYGASEEQMAQWCAVGDHFSTIAKPQKEVDGRAVYCDGESVTTPTSPSPGRKRKGTIV